MRKNDVTHTLKESAAALALAVMGSACTDQLPDSFRYAQRNESFGALAEVNTKVDILWVIDNSASMDASQEKLRQGFEAFAQTYMKPTWDIRSAVITTDTFIANSAFSDYRNSVISGTVNYASPYINSKTQPVTNPAWNPTLLTFTAGQWRFVSGIKQNERISSWRQNYSRLMAGVHDGPITGMCFEGLPHFLDGTPNCNVRDDGTNTGSGNCLTPGGGETSVTQCVNTVFNDTVRSGKAVIETRPPSGTPGDSTWIAGLVRDFRINLTTGTAGHGSERGISSVIQLITDNEGTGTNLFRANSLRVLVFVADEDDQSLTIPAPAPANYSPWSDYRGTMNGEAAGVGCSPKTVGSYTYTLATCPVTAKLQSVSSLKTQIDDFFLSKDGAEATNPNYFVVSIVPTTDTTLQTLQAARDAIDNAIGVTPTIAADRGDRYIELVSTVANDSFTMDIGTADYSPILTQLGQTIISKKGTFQLSRLPTGEEDMIVTLVHANGSSEVVPSSKYTIQGQAVVITDLDFVLSLVEGDVIVVNYQPKSAS